MLEYIWLCVCVCVAKIQLKNTLKSSSNIIETLKMFLFNENKELILLYLYIYFKNSIFKAKGVLIRKIYINIFLPHEK